VKKKRLLVEEKTVEFVIFLLPSLAGEAMNLPNLRGNVTENALSFIIYTSHSYI
jgi:hypothetical protein